MGYLQTTYAFSERRACRVVGAQRRTMRYQRRIRADEDALRTRLRSLAGLRSRWGYRRLHVLLPTFRTFRMALLAIFWRTTNSGHFCIRGADSPSE